MNATNQTVEWIVLTQSGEPVDALDLASAMVIDLEYLPRFAHKPHIAPGRVTLPVADEPFAVCLPAPVEEFGNVYLYADNAGMGMTEPPADRRLPGLAGPTESAGQRPRAQDRWVARPG